MTIESILTELQQKLNLSMYGLGKKLGLKSSAHVWMMKSGQRKPNIQTCHKIINLGKEVGFRITLDMLRGQS